MIEDSRVIDEITALKARHQRYLSRATSLWVWSIVATAICWVLFTLSPELFTTRKNPLPAIFIVSALTAGMGLLWYPGFRWFMGFCTNQQGTELEKKVRSADEREVPANA